MRKQTFVMSLGGSLVSPEAGRVDTEFLKKFRALILKYVKRGQRFAIIVGGGRVCRAWQEAGRTLGIKNTADLDWIGIRTTHLNMELVRAMFGSRAYARIIEDPAEKVPSFSIVFGAGYEPGSSSDYDAVVRAKTVRATTVINLSNIAHVYDKDPRTHKDAKPLRAISWKEYLKRFGVKWVPGANVPFDTKAARLASLSKIRVAFMDGHDLKNVERFLQGKSFRGTLIG